jgi:DNA-binding CsgD family transcriptional regulator
MTTFECPAAVLNKSGPDALGGLATALMDAIECGLIACESDATVVYFNRAARHEMGPDRALRIEDGVLEVNGADARALRVAIAEAASRGLRRLLWLGEGPARVMAATMPVLATQGRDGPKALVLLGRRSLCSPLGLEMLALRHRLTLAEKRVLGALIDTREPRQIACDHGVRLSTVRTQIQAIRDKVGARSIDELLLRVAQVPAMALNLA